jgi:hypothetical protein
MKLGVIIMANGFMAHYKFTIFWPEAMYHADVSYEMFGVDALSVDHITRYTTQINNGQLQAGLSREGASHPTT